MIAIAIWKVEEKLFKKKIPKLSMHPPLFFQAWIAVLEATLSCFHVLVHASPLNLAIVVALRKGVEMFCIGSHIFRSTLLKGLHNLWT